MQKVYQRHGYEAWAKWDDTAKVYDLFTDAECTAGTVWIGYADTIEEARKIGEQYIHERYLNTFQVTPWNS